MVRPNIINIYIFKIRKKRSFVVAHNIQEVKFKKIEVAYIFPFFECDIFLLIISKDNMEKKLQFLYKTFFSIFKSKGSRCHVNIIKDPVQCRYVNGR